MKLTGRYILGVWLGLLLIFASSGFLLYFWNSKIGYYIVVLLASFLSGVIITEFDKSLKILTIAFILGTITFIWLVTLTPVIFGENYKGEIDLLITFYSTDYSRTVIVSFPASIFICLFGCFVGKSIPENTS